MNSWEIWFADGRVERHQRAEQLSVDEMETILDGYLDLQTILSDGRICDMVVRWDAVERQLAVNERATECWRSALIARGLKSLRSEVIRGDVIVLGYPLLRRVITPAARLEPLRAAAEQAMYVDLAGLDRAAIEFLLEELLEIDQEAQRAGYRAAVQNAIAQYRAILSQMTTADDPSAGE